MPAEDGIEEYYIYPRDIFQGPGHRFVGPSGIILTTIYLILLSITIIYGLVQVWPPQGSTLSSGISTVTLFQLTSPISFQLTFPISEEGRLFIIVSLAGALGSAVHANRSFYTYVGERKLVLSWLAYYIILPISGAILGLIFYITVRGGLFAQATAQQTSPFGFAAVAALVGLFSVQALSKLEEVANTVFTRPPERGDSFKEKSQGETQAKRSDDEKPPSETKK